MLAETTQDRIWAETMPGNGKAHPSPVTVYLNGLAPSGRRSMRSLLAMAANHLRLEGPPEQVPWHQFKYQDMALLRSLLLATGKSANTVNTALAAVRGVVAAAFNMGLMSAEDYLRVKQVKRVKEQRLPAGRSLSSAEIRALRRACQQDESATGVRDTALLAVMVSGGLRRSELVSLQVADYAPSKGLLRVNAGKGNKQREVFFSTGARRAIRLWLDERGLDSGPIFCRIYRCEASPSKPITSQRVYAIVKRRAEEAGIASISPHDLRRTFITRLLENGIDLNTVRQLAGHEEIQTTVQYDRRDKKIQRSAMRSMDKAFCL